MIMIQQHEENLQAQIAKPYINRTPEVTLTLCVLINSQMFEHV